MATVKNVISDGDKVTWKVQVVGDVSRNSKNVQLAFTIPTGVSLTGPKVTPTGNEIKVSKGAYNHASNIWFVGDLDVGEKSGVVDFEFTVDDVTQADPLDDSFIITAVVSFDGTDSDETNNDTELFIKVVEDCQVIDVTIGTTI